MASNTQQFGIRGPNQPRMVNEIGAASNQRLENQLTDSMEDSHFGQDRIRDHMQLNNSDPHRIPIRGRLVINSRLRTTKHHLSNNSSNNNSRECLLKATLHLWKT
ncbi:hypothetical protein CR513_00623, partial [Mucuna pruriens]